MGQCKDLSDFDKGQIMMAGAALVGCSQSAGVIIYQKGSKEGPVVNRRQGHWQPRPIDGSEERRLALSVGSNR